MHNIGFIYTNNGIAHEANFGFERTWLDRGRSSFWHHDAYITRDVIHNLHVSVLEPLSYRMQYNH